MTFLFTDIEGSTQLLQRLGDAYLEVHDRHRRLLRAAFERHGGIELGTEGDSFFVVFRSAREAVAAAVEAQASLAAEPWSWGELRVRMGLHTGEVTAAGNDYVGLAVNEAARIASAAHGGQILVSSATREEVGDEVPAGTSVEDLGQHRLKDLARPWRLFQVMHPHLPQDLPPIRTLSLMPNNLPHLLTSFIGREREMVEISTLLRRSRLVTLTGIGGTGKTRLSLQVAGAASERFRDGVWFVELAPLEDGSFIEAAIASAIGVREQPGRPLLQTIADEIRDAEALILLDNAEHVVEECARVTSGLLTETARPRVLATSREPLGVSGEQLYAVPSLEKADPGDPIEALLQSEALRLFADRASLADPAFSLSDSAETVAEICRRLDGIPLAIELAAARVRGLPPDEILHRLDDRFRLLVGTSRTALPRQQTLRGAIDWSHDLLGARERTMFARLAVFAGGSDLAAAEAVCPGGGIEADEVVDLVTSLIDRSLVVRRPGRYLMLETIREYAHEKLVGAGEAERIAHRHLMWCVELAERAAPELQGAGQAEWLDRLDLEIDNFRAALDGALAEPDPDLALRLTAALGEFWRVRSYWREGWTRLERAEEASRGQVSIPRAKVLEHAANVTYMRGDLEPIRALSEEALAIARALGNRRGEVESLISLSGVVEPHQATAFYQQALGISKEIGYQLGIAKSVGALAEMARLEGRYSEARSLYEESLRVARIVGQHRMLAVILANLGRCLVLEGDSKQARPVFRESVGFGRRVGELRIVAESLDGWAGVILAEGNAEKAARVLGAADQLRETIGAGMDRVDRIFYERVRDDLRSALGDEAFDRFAAQGRAMTLDDVVALAVGDES